MVESNVLDTTSLTGSGKIVRYERRTRNRIYDVIGIKGPKPRTLYRWLNDLNQFEATPQKVPAEYRSKPLSEEYIREFVWKPRKPQAQRQKLPWLSEGYKMYEIHDNGGVPFVAYVRENSVKVYRIPRRRHLGSKETTRALEAGYMWEYYTELVVDIPAAERVFIGTDVGEPNGNSILVQISHTQKLYRYIHIGDAIFAFTSNEPIAQFFSNIGNSDVPYPVALSKDWVYQIWVKQQVPRAAFTESAQWNDDDWAESSHDYIAKDLGKKATKLKNVRVLVKAPFG